MIKKIFCKREQRPSSLGRMILVLGFILGWEALSISQPATLSILQVSPNGRYFLDENGMPFFWQGDTEWELFHRFSAKDAGELIKERKKQGFNVIQVMVTGVYPEWGKMQGMKPWTGSQAWGKNNPLSPDEDYFKRTDSIISEAEEIGMILVIGVFHARDKDEGRIKMDNAESWAKWLAGRCKNSRNIVWSMYPHADSSSMAVVRATVKGLREGDGGTHLVTMHPDPSPTSSSFMHTEPWLSFNTLQTWNTGFINHEMVQSDFHKIPVKPVIDGEARYEEEDGTTPFETRRAGYWAILAGGFYSYGHRDNWKSPQTWREWVDTPGAQQMKIMGDIFRSLSWWNLVPDQSIFVNPMKGNAAARSSDDRWIIAYITHPGIVTITLKSMNSYRQLAAWWIDPITGERSEAGSFTPSGNKDFDLPLGWQDGILLIVKK